MKKYILVNNQGAVLSVQTPTWEHQLTEGWDGDVYVKEVPASMDTHELLTDFYWNFEDSALVNYPYAKPSTFYNWNGVDQIWEKDDTEFLRVLKSQRNILLKNSDWTQMPDSPLTTEQKADWATYRQALRDLPSTLLGTEAVIEDALWPTEPTT